MKPMLITSEYGVENMTGYPYRPDFNVVGSHLPPPRWKDRRGVFSRPSPREPAQPLPVEMLDRHARDPVTFPRE